MSRERTKANSVACSPYCSCDQQKNPISGPARHFEREWLISSQFMNALACSRFTALLISVAFAFALPSAPVSAAEPSAEVTAKALRSRAEAFEKEADFSSAAEIWVELMAEDSDPDSWLVAAYRAQQTFRTASNSEDDKNHLCRAREVIAEVLANDGLEADERADFEDFRLEVEADLIVDFNTDCSLGQIPDLLPVHWQAVSEAGPRAPLSGNANDTLPGPADGKRSVLTIITVTTDTASGGTDSGSTGGADTKQTPMLLPLEAGHLADNTEPASRKTLALRVNGGITLGLGLVALGVMTPFAHRDWVIGEELLGIAQLKEQSGGHLSAANAERVEMLHAEGQKTLRRSLALGIVGGASTVAGIALLLASRRVRSSKMVSLQPKIDLSQGSRSFSFSLEGRF